MSLDHTAPSRIREFRHLFAGHRRIVAIIRVDLAGLRFQPGIMSCIRCEWEGSKGQQPSAELYSEFKEWADFVFPGLATKTGASLLCVFELPEPAKRIEAWLYEGNCDPRMLKSWANPFKRPLFEVLAGKLGGNMPLIAFSIKLDRIDESLLYQDPGGGWWLSAVCTLEEDSKGRRVVAQSIPKERYTAGEKGPAVGTWREIGASKPAQSEKDFDLARYNKPPAPDQKPLATSQQSTGNGPLFPDEEEGMPP